MVKANVQPAHGDSQTVATPPITNEAARLLADVRDLAPGLAARSDEIEDLRRIPYDIIETLRRTGMFKALVPRSHGGLELSFPEVLPAIATLAAADSSVGWVTMIGVNSQLFCTRLPRQTYDRVFGDGANAFVAGSGTPAGRAEIVDGGYRVSGRWPFVSGCQNAQWLTGHCVVCRDGEPVTSGDRATTTFIILPAGRWRIEDTWRSSGLAGTGSHHVVLDDAGVTEAEIFDPLHGPSAVPGPLESVIAPFVASSHGALAVGIAIGAMADLAAMADAGRRQLFAISDLRDSPVFQHEFGRLDAELRAARALLDVQADTQWRRAAMGTLDGEADFAEALQGSAWIHAACSNVVGGCYALGGSNSIMTASPLQRRLRDIHAARQHFFAQERFYASVGRNALGFPSADPIAGH